MAKCGFCNSTIIMGGVTAGGSRFCNKKCYQNAAILSVSQNIPADALDRHLDELWRGSCPKCKRTGPVDVHRVYEVWSALVLTRWSTKQMVSCRSCARNRQIQGLFFSLAFGWWGFPWGLILTPVQVTRNAIAMFGGVDNARPSADLRKIVQVNIGARMMAEAKQAPPPVR